MGSTFLCAYLLVYSRVQIFCMVVFLCVSKKYSDIKIEGQKNSVQKNIELELENFKTLKQMVLYLDSVFCFILLTRPFKHQ